ncbi:NADPH-dependent 2,4-dienoyl-CoA reductase/sulfur reductase-like enzyme [Geothermobacter ehrlichii]|uniref:NADPH-dependent 2,4-dienoyl-CoA reductase/sulfur reductase-like enzyme n=1 Tax=Geothermobacter ehrlichii TaxID=213224 RepID=A0A5D3WK63_9BACT|nr:FAD-dependent oxidoreductase [Geothermobacter ehrlichii]TYO99352.1 NADPH-dependent 2,4-dienoyl-CoA reductase/sulfur reductase-like enzyme [Geothermobacter ehrlichii]
MSENQRQILIVGGVAAGMKTASRLRRLDPEAKITVIERGHYLSYGACALPYVLAGEIGELDEVRRTTNGTLRDETFFARVKGVEVLTRCEALRIDRENRRLEVRFLDDDRRQTLSYDALVLATGSSPLIPPLPGTELDGVLALKKVEDAAAIAELVRPEARAVIVGGGLIGLEMAEALRARHMEVRLLEMQPQVLSGILDADLAEQVHRTLRQNGVELHLGEALKGIEEKDGRVGRVITTSGSYPADLVILALGVKPNVELAREAGLKIGVSGAIAVNERMQTSDPAIYAAGDCVESRHQLNGTPLYLPLGSTANKQGRVVADNLGGIDSAFSGVLGTLLVKVFGLNVGRTGLSKEAAEKAGFEPVSILAPSPDRVHSMPSARPILTRLTVDRKSRRLLGAQIVGPGETAKRIDVVATALSLDATLDQLAEFDLGYAPPYSAAMDPLHQAANALRNKLDGLADSLSPLQLKQRLDAGEKILLLDVRSPDEYAEVRIPGATLLPLGQLRSKIAELPKDRLIVPFCKISLRGYEATRILLAAGFDQVAYLEGGILGWPWELERGVVEVKAPTAA